MLTQHTLILLCVFLGIAGVVYALVSLFDPYWYRVKARIDELEGKSSTGSLTVEKRLKAASNVLPRVSAVLSRIAPHGKNDRARLQHRLSRAGIYDPAAISQFFAIKLLLMVATLALSLLVVAIWPVPWHKAIIGGCLLGALGSIAPGLWLDRRIAIRMRMLRRSLPDFLDLMIVCLEGGLSIQESVRRVSEELQLAHRALALELSIVQRDIELGATVAAALKRFAARSDYEGVKTLSTFVREAQRFGTNLSNALRLHADMLRTQRETAAEELAQKASVKILLPTLLCIFPAIFIVLVAPALIQIQEAFAAR